MNESVALVGYESSVIAVQLWVTQCRRSAMWYSVAYDLGSNTSMTVLDSTVTHSHAAGSM